jgi:hypothetical protein
MSPIWLKIKTSYRVRCIPPATEHFDSLYWMQLGKTLKSNESN